MLPAIFLLGISLTFSIFSYPKGAIGAPTLEKRDPDPGYILTSELIARAGESLFLVGSDFSLLQNPSHTLQVSLDGKVIFEIGVDNTGFFRVLIPEIPSDTKPGTYELKAIILPEHVSHNIKLAVCNADGTGCETDLGFLVGHRPILVETFFSPTELSLGHSVLLYGDGFHVPEEPGPVAEATVWIDRSCQNASPGCVETGINLGSAPVYSSIYGNGIGTFTFLVVIPTTLDIHPMHRLEAYVNTEVAQIMFKATPPPS